MRNSANVSQGPIYIGGYLTMDNTSSIGTASLPIALSVANARCPVGGGATFPQICNTGTNPNPITINGTQPHVYGPVSANDQTNAYASNMTGPGLVATSGVSAPALPGYDRVVQVNAVSTTWTPAQANCSGSGPSAITSVTWPANLKITGDITISNSCTITVSGNVWITGSLTLRNSAIMKVGSGVTTQPTIMVDGSSGVVLQQTSSVATNATSVGMEFITFYSTNSCTTATTAATYCDSLTGTSLYNSQSLITINIGNQGAAAGSVFYAKYTEVTLGQGGSYRCAAGPDHRFGAIRQSGVYDYGGHGELFV
jgi:hypothetical protein